MYDIDFIGLFPVCSFNRISSSNMTSQYARSCEEKWNFLSSRSDQSSFFHQFTDLISFSRTILQRHDLTRLVYLPQRFDLLADFDNHSGGSFFVLLKFRLSFSTYRFKHVLSTFSACSAEAISQPLNIQPRRARHLPLSLTPSSERTLRYRWKIKDADSPYSTLLSDPDTLLFS